MHLTIAFSRTWPLATPLMRGVWQTSCLPNAELSARLRGCGVPPCRSVVSRSAKLYVGTDRLPPPSPSVGDRPTGSCELSGTEHDADRSTPHYLAKACRKHLMISTFPSRSLPRLSTKPLHTLASPIVHTAIRLLRTVSEITTIHLCATRAFARDISPSARKLPSDLSACHLLPKV